MVQSLLSRVIAFFHTRPDQPPLDGDAATIRRIYERKRWSVFLSVTFGYGMFYVCRINFSVAKKPMLDEGVLDTTQMGIMGSAMLVAYAVGKLVNGFLADRSNIARFLSTGLLLSALANLALGFNNVFWAFILLWGVSGWFQSTGSAPSVVSLSHWFSNRERGTRYGIWSISHSLGEGATFALTAMLVAALGWRWGFWGPGLASLAVALLLYHTLADRPETYGLPPVAEYKQDPTGAIGGKKSVGALQLGVLRNWAVWVLGLASATMYVARYGINNWGPLFLQDAKGYSMVEAGAVMATYPVLGLMGSASSGIISDRLFNARRNLPCLIYGLLEIAALTGLYLVPPGHRVLDSALLGLFGFALGSLLVYLGGLMAADLVPQRAVGAAMGMIGLFSYLGAAIQDTVSGVLLDAGSSVVEGVTVYSWDAVFTFWIAASVASVILASSTWKVRAVT